jgi:uncharacterized protein
MTFLRLAPEGRGSGYHPVRGFLESSLRIAYRGDWPARLWQLVPRSCRVQCIQHTLRILPPTAASLRIGFISDLHIGPTTPRKLIEAAFERLAGESLDVLLLGGDYVFLDATPRAADLLASLVRTVGAPRKFAVLGNHDLWTQHHLLESALQSAGVELLMNESVRLDPKHGVVAIIGFDDPWTGSLDADRAVQGARGADAAIVLCHSPDGLPEATRALEALPSAPAGLYVCGHTHGGQIATPWGPIVVPGFVGKKYPFGFHHVPPLHLYVSRGVGATELPIRTYAAPEVAVFELLGR